MRHILNTFSFTTAVHGRQTALIAQRTDCEAVIFLSSAVFFAFITDMEHSRFDHSAKYTAFVLCIV